MPRKAVFISYSHDSNEHLEKILGLAERLRQDGLDAQLDQYVNGTPEQGWPRWMLDHLDEASFVLIVCTETYYRRFRGQEVSSKGRGADWEGALITQEIYDAKSRTVKFVPVTLSEGQKRFIPEPLRGHTYYELTSEERYQALYRFLVGQPSVEPSPLGFIKPVLKRVTQPLTFGPPIGHGNPREHAGISPIMNKGFDVFLSHNSKDKPLVRKIAEHLERYGLTSWLDEEDLRPGLPFQDGLEEVMRTTQAAAVCLGGHGLGPWQQPEVRALLSLMVERGQPVILILLPGAPEMPQIGLSFLSENTWVDLREGITEEGLARLFWGITGEKPKKKKPAPGATQGGKFVPEDTVDLPSRGSGEPPASTIEPLPLTANEKPREVFISYAWGDDETPEGRIRAKVVEALSSALTENGFLPIRDRDQIRPGELISAFIRRLTRGDLVVAVISDKYLRSPYCMYEIYKLWQKSQEDADLLAELLVPIVLPDVKVDRLRDRAPYIRYWREQKEEMDELFRELGSHLDPGSLRELRQIRDFAQDVDSILVFLQDVLMPRKLEVHLDDGFQAVLQALRRRVDLGE